MPLPNSSAELTEVKALPKKLWAIGSQARQKLQQGLADYLAGKGSEAIVFRLKRTKKANHAYPLKLTQQQRETLLECTQLSRNLKKKIEQAGESTQIVPVTWNELHKLNDETGQAAYYARSPHKQRLMAVMTRSSSSSRKNMPRSSISMR